jgi:hypothetical protein
MNKCYWESSVESYFENWREMPTPLQNLEVFQKREKLIKQIKANEEYNRMINKHRK